MIRDSIQAARIEQGMSIAALAKASGIARSNVSQFLAGHRDLQVPSLDRLCKVLGLELENEKSREARKCGTARRGRDD